MHSLVCSVHVQARCLYDSFVLLTYFTVVSAESEGCVCFSGTDAESSIMGDDTLTIIMTWRCRVFFAPIAIYKFTEQLRLQNNQSYMHVLTKDLLHRCWSLLVLGLRTGHIRRFCQIAFLNSILFASRLVRWDCINVNLLMHSGIRPKRTANTPSVTDCFRLGGKRLTL